MVTTTEANLLFNRRRAFLDAKIHPFSHLTPNPKAFFGRDKRKKMYYRLMHRGNSNIGYYKSLTSLKEYLNESYRKRFAFLVSKETDS